MYPAKRYENPTILACLNNLVKFEWAAKVFVQPEDLNLYLLFFFFGVQVAPTDVPCKVL